MQVFYVLRGRKTIGVNEGLLSMSRRKPAGWVLGIGHWDVRKTSVNVNNGDARRMSHEISTRGRSEGQKAVYLSEVW